MTDAELLDSLIGLFESREDAEHMATCPDCSVFESGFMEPGPGRCAANPVTIAEDAAFRAAHPPFIGPPDPNSLMAVTNRALESGYAPALRANLIGDLPWLFDK